MADEDAPTPKPPSPREDYDPLRDDIFHGHDADGTASGDDHGLNNNFDTFDETESPLNSFDMETPYFMGFGTTPPVNTREVKRSKEKTRSLNKMSKLEMKALQSHKDHGTIRQVYSGVILSALEGGDSEVEDDIVIVSAESSVERTMSAKKKRDSSRLFKTSRTNERDAKHGNGQYTDTLEVPSVAAMTHTIKIDSPNRFMSLNCKPVSHFYMTPSPENKVQVPRMRQQSSNIECPANRIEFSKIFTRLINMGTNVRKDREKREHSYQRQISQEQEVWQTKLNDVLWLELQAWHANKTIEEMDEWLCQEREKAQDILPEIINFKVKDPDSSPDTETSDISSVSQSNTTTESDTGDSQQTVVAGPSNIPSPEFMQKQKEAIITVRDLLQKLEVFERLYPTMKAFGKDKELYASVDFKRRVQTLCLWLNITIDLSKKLKTLAKYLGVENIQGLAWHYIDNDLAERDEVNPRDAIDFVIEEYYSSSEESEYSEEEEEEEEDMDTDGLQQSMESQKSVRFIPGSPERPLSPNTNQFLDPNSITPSDTSTPIKVTARSTSNYSASSDVSLEYYTCIYRTFVDKSLKKGGMRKLVYRMKDLLEGTLQRARDALEKPRPSSYAQVAAATFQSEENRDVPVTPSPSMSLLPELVANTSVVKGDSRLVEHAPWNQEFTQMGLPSFKPAYLFLVRVPLDVIHESLRLRLEQQPETDPSILCIRQLIHECKEVLKAGVIVKQYYQVMVQAVMWNDEVGAEENFERDLERFDDDMKAMLKVYFGYMQTWMHELQSLPQASRGLKNALEKEWEFSKEICPHVRGGEAEAGRRFCLMASSLLGSISSFLENGIDDCINKLYDSTIHDSLDESSNELQLRHSRSMEMRHSVIQTCRAFKNLFHEARERSSKALGFAKMMRKDLEIAADFNISVSSKVLLEKLKETQHIKVISPHTAGYMMFIPSHIAENTREILVLLNVTCGQDDVAYTDSPQGYLLLVRCEEEGSNGPKTSAEWDGPIIRVEPTAETTIALSHIEVEGLLLVVIHSSQLSSQRKSFEKRLGKTLELVNEQTSCHQAIAESLAELKLAAEELREKISYAIIQIDEKLDLRDLSEMEEGEKTHILKLYRETLHQCYNFGFEYYKEVTRLVTGDARQKLAKVLVDFARQWMSFVVTKCDRGKGTRPRWANQGLDFLITACEPRILACLTEEEFASFQIAIDKCIKHVVGEKVASTSPGQGFKVGSPDLASPIRIFRNLSWPNQEGKVHRSISNKSNSSDPSTANLSTGHRMSIPEITNDNTLGEGDDEGITFQVHKFRKKVCEEGGVQKELSRIQRVCSQIHKMDDNRNQRLRKQHLIGRISGRQMEIDYHVNIRRVNFKWQRGNKIGEGQFGKVYAAVNMETGELMALKEIRFQPNDHQTIKDIADEIKNFEGISNPYLVKYYGVEVHKDELLIFMEFCDAGTIEEVAKVGLTEHLVRNYTRELLIAINVLHENGIVHRDIKGANIFLTSTGPIKLGDFGCSVKLKNHTTMPGEVNTLVGTTAFMAPEVITRNDAEGHGRAADIWSLGCVVLEMITGKRPWHELENNYQIMFKVGMGGTPTIPDNLSREGKDFLTNCFEPDPDQRWTASQLLEHPFIKVFTEEEAHWIEQP